MVLSSLFPRLWPKLPVEEAVDTWEETVLVRLGANEFEYAE